jgi:predicted acyltransferase
MRVTQADFGKTGTCSLCGRALKVTAEAAKPLPAQPPAQPPAIPPIPKKATQRILAMDQLRGYAIFGMIVVNYLGYFDVMPWILKHHKSGFSYADTIAPLFIFVVGMGFRLSLKRRTEKDGFWQARWHAAKRYSILFLVGIAFYGPAMHIDWWDALTDIALAGLLALPFIDKKLPVRVAAAAGYLTLFMIIYMKTDYGTVFMMRSMNGGPIGPLSWVFVLLFGTIAYDLLESRDTTRILTWSLVSGIGLLIAAWIALYLTPVDWADYGEKFGPYWALSKRWCVAPSMFLATGVCFLIFLFFYWVCEIQGFEFPHLTVLGENPLIIYLLQYALLEMNGVYIAEDHGAVVALVGFACFYGFCYLAAKRLHDQKILIKL